jgi:hypothetical protein
MENELDELIEYLTDFEDDGDMEDEEDTDNDITEEELNERKLKKVVRGGKIIKKIQCKDGYKAVGNKCVKQSASEKRLRKKAARKAAKKRKGKEVRMNKKRARSMRKRAHISERLNTYLSCQ